MARSTKRRQATGKAKPAPARQGGPEHIILEGMAPHMQAFNLPHDVYCARMGKCYCTDGQVITSFKSPVDQKTHLRVQARKNNSVLTIRYRRRAAVPREALQCPEVAAALAAKRLRVRS
jgi:hypothetical protein